MLEEWPTAIQDVINMFQNQQLPNVSQHTQYWILFDVLTGVAEESASIYTSVQRVQLKAEIYKNAPLVLSTMEQFINTKCDQKKQLDEEDLLALLNVAKCSTVWFKHGSIPLPDCVPHALSLLKLVSKCYWNSIEGDGSMSADESELAEHALKALSV